jgi:hypothetical protein
MRQEEFGEVYVGVMFTQYSENQQWVTNTRLSGDKAGAVV